MAKPRLLDMKGTIIRYEDARVHVLSTAMKYAAHHRRVTSFGTTIKIPMRRSSWWKVICGSIFGMAVHVSAGEMFVVPKGVEHKPYAEREVKLLLIEPRGVL